MYNLCINELNFCQLVFWSWFIYILCVWFYRTTSTISTCDLRNTTFYGLRQIMWSVHILSPACKCGVAVFLLLLCTVHVMLIPFCCFPFCLNNFFNIIHIPLFHFCQFLVIWHLNVSTLICLYVHCFEWHLTCEAWSFPYFACEQTIFCYLAFL